MPARWTLLEERVKRKELSDLYIKKNKTIGEIAALLGLAENAVYDRLIRLNIPIVRHKKVGFNNKRSDILIPKIYSEDLAEFVGILLGDGHISPTQILVTLSKKDQFTLYVKNLIRQIFKIKARVIKSKTGDITTYFGSVEAVRYFLKMGLTINKVKSQVSIPNWIFRNKKFMRRVLRGLFDTDGSVYKLKFGTQISFCNHSRPLLTSVRKMLYLLGFSPSKISGYNLYLTKRSDLGKFFKEIGFGNRKHINRFLKFYK
jgi:hypothetical protein